MSWFLLLSSWFLFPFLPLDVCHRPGKSLNKLNLINYTKKSGVRFFGVGVQEVKIDKTRTKPGFELW